MILTQGIYQKKQQLKWIYLIKEEVKKLRESAFSISHPPPPPPLQQNFVPSVPCVCNFLETFFRGRESANIFCTVLLLLVTTYNYSKKVFGRFVFSVVVVAASSVNHLPSVVHFVYPFG